MRHRASLVLGVFWAVVTLSTCADGGPRVLQVAILDGARALTLGETLRLTAEVTAVGSATTAIVWSAEGDAATVDDGLVTAVAHGTASITATSAFDASKADSVDVHVVPFGSHAWTHQFGSERFDFAWAVTVDSADAVLVAGGTAGSLDGQAAAGSDDAFVRKLDRDGRLLWTDQFGSIANDLAYGVAADASDQLLVVGYTMGSMAGQAHLGGGDAFVRKLGSDGEPRWTHQFGTPGNDAATSVAVDAAGNGYVAGYTAGSLPDQTQRGERDAFLRRLDPDGQHVWTSQFGSDGSTFAEAVAIDATGSVVVVGATDGALVADAHQGEFDVFVRKFDPAGPTSWTRQFGTVETDYATGVALDLLGNAYVVGYTRGALAGHSSAGGTDAFMTKLDPNGAHVWTQQFGSGANDLAFGVAVDAFGDVLVTGYTRGALEGAEHAGGVDAFTIKFTPNGEVRWTQQFGSDADDFAYGAATDARGFVVVVGETHGRLGDAHAGDADAFVRRTHR